MGPKMKRPQSRFESTYTLDFRWERGELIPIDDPTDALYSLVLDLTEKEDGCWLIKTSGYEHSWEWRIHGQFFSEDWEYYVDVYHDVNVIFTVWFKNVAELHSYLLHAAAFIEVSRHASWITKSQDKSDETTMTESESSVQQEEA